MLRDRTRQTSDRGSHITKASSQLDMRNPVGDIHARLTNIQSEAAAIAALSFIHGKASAKETRASVAQMFTDAAVPDLVFGICRRFPACISFVSSILMLCVEVPDFGKRALRNRTVVAFIRFLTSNESLAAAFDLLLSTSQALKVFAVSEGEKVLTDVMNQLRGRARAQTIVSLMRIVARLVSEPPNSTQERNNLLSACLLLIVDSDCLLFLMEGCKGDALTFIDALLVIIRAGGAVDTMTIPVEATCLLVAVLIEDGCKGLPEDARIADWDNVSARLVTAMTAFPLTDNRRSAPFVGNMWGSAARHAKALSSNLATTLLQCAAQWMQKGWMMPQVIDIVNAAFAHPFVMAEQRYAIIVLLHSCNFKVAHASLAQLNIPAIRGIFSAVVLRAHDSQAVAALSAEEKFLCEFWICFVHLATFLRLAPVIEFFRPLSVHIAAGRIRERTFTEITRWPRNDSNDEKRALQCRNDLQQMRQIEDEEAHERATFDVIFSDIAAYYKDFRATLTELEKDPRFVQKFHAWKLAVNDDRNLFAGKMAILDTIKTELRQFVVAKSEDIHKVFREHTIAEKQAHLAEIDGIVWDADEMATKELAHTNRLAQIESAFEKESREVNALSNWRLGLCDQVMGALSLIEAKRPRRLLNFEKEEERLRGVAVVSSVQWVDTVHDHEGAHQSITRQEALERSLVTQDASYKAIEHFRQETQRISDFEQMHMEDTLDIEETRDRHVVELMRDAFVARPDLHKLADAFVVAKRSGSPQSPTSGSPVNKSLSPRSGSGGLTSSSVSTSPSGQSLQPHGHSHGSGHAIHQGGAKSPKTTPRSSKTAQLIAQFQQAELKVRLQIEKSEQAWHRYNAEACEMDRRKLYYVLRTHQFQQLQLASLEDSDRIRLVREWMAASSTIHAAMANALSAAIQQQQQQAQQQQQLQIARTLANSAGDSMKNALLSGNSVSFSNTSGSNPMCAPEFTKVRESQAVLGCLKKATIKYRSSEIQEMEAHRRGRIIMLFRIFINEMRSQLTQLHVMQRVQWACIDAEIFARYQEIAEEEIAFRRLVDLRVLEDKYTVPLRHIHEIERQNRSQIHIDERIALQQVLINRPRGKRFRPLREIENEHVRTSNEPGLAPRVKGWLKGIIHHNPMPCFTEVFTPIVHVLASELKIPASPKMMSPPAVDNSNVVLQADGDEARPAKAVSVAATAPSPITPIATSAERNESSTLIAPSFSSGAPSGVQFRSPAESKEVNNVTTISGVHSFADGVSATPSAAPVSQQSLVANVSNGSGNNIAPASAAVNEAASAPQAAPPASHFAARLRDEIKVERSSALVLKMVQKLETARREEVARCECVARHAFGYQFAKLATMLKLKLTAGEKRRKTLT